MKNTLLLTEPLTDFLDDTKLLFETICASCMAIEWTSKAQELFGDSMENHEKYDKNQFESIVGTMKNEASNGFQMLYLQGTLLMYSHLEDVIKKLILRYFRDNDLKDIDKVNTIKITYAEYEGLDQEERLEYIFVLFEKQFQGNMKNGVFRFEELLKPLGLSGKVDLKIANSIMELSLLRNLIAHRGGFVDRKFIALCAEKHVRCQYENGQKIRIEFEKFQKFYLALVSYSNLIRHRIIVLNEIEDRDQEHFTKIAQFHDRLHDAEQLATR